MTSDTPSTSPEMQAQAPATAAPGRTNSNRRPWLEPAVVVAVIGVAVTIFCLLLSIVFGIYSMNNHIDALGSELKADIRDLNNRMDTLGSDFSTRIGTLGSDFNTRSDALGSDFNTRIDALGSELKADIRDLNNRMDTLGSDFNTRIDALGSELKAGIRDLNARVDALGSDFNVRIGQVYQLLLGTTENRHVPASLRSSIRET